MPGAGSARRTDRDRAEVLATAKRLIVERGFDGISMREIADALDFGVSGLYRHVESKDDLLLGVTAPMLDAIDELLDRPPPQTRAEQRRLLYEFLELLLSDRQTARIIGGDAAVKAHPAVGGRVREQDARLRRALVHHDPSDARAEQYAAAALGAIWWPLICLTEDALLGEELIHAALAVLARERR